VVEDSPTQEAAASIHDSVFQPAELTIQVGTTVIWTQNSVLPHTVTADDGSFNSGTLQNGDTFEFTFTEPGRFPYFCSFHGAPGGLGMAGIIIVENASATTSDSPPLGNSNQSGDPDYP
jgi:plastocyanin